MADSFRPRFLKPSVLRQVGVKWLFRFLKPYLAWLTSSGLTIRSERDLDHDMLDLTFPRFTYQSLSES
jgi:hypothetical protein